MGFCCRYWLGIWDLIPTGYGVLLSCFGVGAIAGRGFPAQGSPRALHGFASASYDDSRGSRPGLGAVNGDWSFMFDRDVRSVCK
jgi:hypothetical protein